MKFYIFIYIALLVLVGCQDAQSVTLTDPKTGEKRTFNCDELISNSWSEVKPGLFQFRKPTVESSDLNFILPNLDTINGKALIK